MELQKAYQGANLTPAQQQFNANMSSARIAVEWTFGEVATTWAYVDMKKQQKILLQPVALYYRVTALLSNLRTILRYGNKAAEHFVVSPPTSEEYLHKRPCGYYSRCHCPDEATE